MHACCIWITKIFLSLDNELEQGGVFYIALNFVWYNFAFIARESELFRNLSEVALDVVNEYILARKNFIALNVFLHFSGLLNRSSRWAPAYHEEKFAIFNSHRCCNEIFIASFFAHRRRKEHSSIRADQGTPAKKNTAKSEILKFRLFTKRIDAMWYLRGEISFDPLIERKNPINYVVKL